MDRVRPFLIYLKKFVSLSEEEFRELLLPIISVKKFEKKEQLTREGEVENYFYFVLKGLIRKFYLKGREEINTQIDRKSVV